MIDNVINDFFKAYNICRNDFGGVSFGHNSQGGLEVYSNNNNLHRFSVDYVDTKEEFKTFLTELIENNYPYQIVETFLIGYSSEDKETYQKLHQKSIKDYKQAEQYCNKFNQESQYWECNFDMGEIENNEGWQYLLSFTMELKNFYSIIEELKKSTKGDENMFEDLIARIRVYKSTSDKECNGRPYDLELIYSDTQVFKNINRDSDRNNCSKADFIFQGLIENGVDDDNFDGSESNYDNIKIVEAIGMVNDSLYIDYHNLQYEPSYRGRDGWEICGIDLTRVIMYRFILTDNTVIRFDFQGMIDNEKGTQGIYLQDITDKNAEKMKKYEKEKKVREVIKKIEKEYECYVYTVFDDEYDNYHSMDNINGYDDELACCIEIFSDLADPNDFKEADFGITDEYIDSIIKIREETLTESAKIEAKYNKYMVKTTTSKWNQGCEFGMAIYVWIPYQ